jgi:hypothetical protein
MSSCYEHRAEIFGFLRMENYLQCFDISLHSHRGLLFLVGGLVKLIKLGISFALKNLYFFCYYFNKFLTFSCIEGYDDDDDNDDFDVDEKMKNLLRKSI